jgi:hypothetical protein
MIEFRQKDFSILSSTLQGATSGYAVGSIFGKFRKAKDKEFNEAVPAFVGFIGGAALGALAGVIDNQRTRFNRKMTVDARLMDTIVENLKKDNFKEGKDFTRDPKIATQLKTKVCICISKVSGDLRILINMVSDPKLQGLAKDLVKNIPNKSAVNERASDKFNDITITTISDSSMDAGLVTGVAERFIHSGYPIQLVEVG